MTTTGSHAVAAAPVIPLPRAAGAQDVRSREPGLAANDVHLTNGKHRRRNGRENALSNRILSDRHGDVAQPDVVRR